MTINAQMYDRGAEPSKIRELFAYGIKRKAQIGEDKVFDFSLGNPSVPAPAKVKASIINSLNEHADVHSYTPASGDAKVRGVLAQSIQARFGIPATADNIFMTMGASASITLTLNALCNPGDEVIVIAPYFPEYAVWIQAAGAKTVAVNALPDTFQLDIEAIESAITANTKAIIINSPNNPCGVVYPLEDLEKLAALLDDKNLQFATSIYLIADEPYRELVYDNLHVAYLPCVYNNSIVCYSYSKSLSLPGERIGYVFVPESAHDSKAVYTAICGAARCLGMICAPSIFQRVIADCVAEPANIAAYESNRNLLTSALSEYGYEFSNPDGAFYLWVKSPIPNAQDFSDSAKEYELLIVPSDSFGVSGYVRIGYCVSESVIRGSLPAFKALMQDFKNSRAF